MFKNSLRKRQSMPKSTKKETVAEGMSIQSRLAQLQEDRMKALEENGFKEFFSFPEGETTVQFDLSVNPRESKYGRMIYRIRVSGIEYDWSANPSLELALLEKMAAGQDTFTIIRVGRGREDTRYSIKQ